MTKIEWTDDTLQLTTGCTKVSPGCKNCYAERMHMRLKGMGRKMYLQPFSEVKYWPEQIAKIASRPSPRSGRGAGVRAPRVFINSMSDLFHKDVPGDFIFSAIKAMAERRDITFQILTKRADRLSLLNEIYDDGEEPLPNIWLGVTVCNQAEADEKIPLLLQVPAAVRFVSIEPMLGPVDLMRIQSVCAGSGEDFDFNALSVDPYAEDGLRALWFEDDDEGRGLDWVICGGETGPRARPMHPDWVRSLRDQCVAAGVPFFFKGWGRYATKCRCYLNLRLTSRGKHAVERHGGYDCPIHDWPKLYENSNDAPDGLYAGRVLDGRTWEEMPR